MSMLACSECGEPWGEHLAKCSQAEDPPFPADEAVKCPECMGYGEFSDDCQVAECKNCEGYGVVRSVGSAHCEHGNRTGDFCMGCEQWRMG